jgi:hypothetical protein
MLSLNKFCWILTGGSQMFGVFSVSLGVLIALALAIVMIYFYFKDITQKKACDIAQFSAHWPVALLF